jgi:hypothetical protein
MDEEQFERITSLIACNVELGKKISASALGHDVVVHDADMVESALILENKSLTETLGRLQREVG